MLKNIQTFKLPNQYKRYRQPLKMDEIPKTCSDLFESIVEITQNGNWHLLERKSIQGWSTCKNYFNLLLDHYDWLHHHNQHHQKLDQEIYHQMESILKKELFQSLDLNNLLKNILDNNPEIKKKSAKAFFKQLKLGKFEKSYSLLPTGNAEQWICHLTLSTLVRCFLGILYSRFNLNLKFLSKGPHLKPQSELEQLEQNYFSFYNTLEVQQKTIYVSLIQGNGVLKACQNLTDWIEENLPEWIQIQNKISCLSQLQELSNTLAKKLGALSTLSGDLTRNLIASYAATYVLTLEQKGVNLPGNKKSLAEQSITLPFVLKLPNGKNVSIANLNKEKDGKFVEIMGKVGEHQIVKSTDKDLISKLMVVDISNQSQIEIVAPYVHFAHIGIAQGAICNIHGYYEKKCNMAGKKPAIVVDTLSLRSKLIKSSWKAAFFDLARDYYPRWANGLNMSWSISPHDTRSLTSLDFPMGAGELLFLKFKGN